MTFTMTIMRIALIHALAVQLAINVLCVEAEG
jgi:hypothetical protein